MQIEQKEQAQSFKPGLRGETFLVFSMLLAVFVATSAGFDTSEASYHYEVAEQIVKKGALGFEEPKTGIFTVAPNGRSYASHELGNTVFLLPVAAVNVLMEKTMRGRLPGSLIATVASFLMALVATFYCALTGCLLYSILRAHFGRTVRAALEPTLAFAFCTYIWTYSRNLFDGVLCMALLTGAMASLLHYQRTGRENSYLLAAGLLGTGVVTRISMVLAVAAFAVYVAMAFWGEWRRLFRLTWLGCAALAPFAVWHGYYNHLRTGNWLLTPFLTAQYARNNAMNGDLGTGVAGLLFSPGKSVFVYFPLAILTVYCFRRFFRRWRAEAVLVAVLAGLWLVVHAKQANWYGSWGWGPRHFVTIMPMVALPACVCWEWIAERAIGRWMKRGALAWGFLLAASSIAGNWIFRIFLAFEEKRDGELIWSITGGQAMDMILSSGENLRRLVVGEPGPTIAGITAVHRHVSTTINVWPNMAIYSGVPVALVAAVVAVLALVAGSCGVMLLRIGREGSDAMADRQRDQEA